MTLPGMEELDIAGQRLLIREDLNVPLVEGKIGNDTRIRAALPTIEQAKRAGASVILMSHLGRPEEGKPVAEQAEFSLHPVANRLAELLDCPVRLVPDYLQNPGHAMPQGDEVILLENVRVNAGEKGNDDKLARRYAILCDVFVMDAFGTAHRAQASTHGVAKFAPNSCAGPLLSGELEAIGRALENPERPMLAVVGGAKVSSKLQVLENLTDKVDQLIVGGGIANTFLAAAGFAVGRSLYEPELVGTAESLLERATIPLPIDVVVAREFSAAAQPETKLVGDVATDDMILDIGPQTAVSFAELIGSMNTIIWNGPLGVFEFDQFSHGTQAVARAIAENTGFSLAGGGETIAAIDKFSITEKISYISTGGGAFLELVKGAKLPAVEILRVEK
ncbi:MAG: phosphoglycerate kinase [Gammaproteobacteria bacterium]|nr:phosphoglycerate kinase [Gammaproteobacteria bacterium]MDP6097754.1 phosphoglycerate kinase [Gammaproteobacteria bacterium]MDP7455281.1 phosphoglycerate kinase [Gammaproteobacteria bacterium]HJO12022.1 phosphoglycerate kinase [Gammaproteobacteria bacterium]|tara:strand:+ start:12859 stop:14034 length:1176 start_codon:yes stop_codon:yes gene_type:complete